MDAVRSPGERRAVVVQIKQPVITAVMRQFGHPRGIAGHLAGWVMAHRSSNKQRNRWVVWLLDVQPTDRVLEIGFGPGLAIAELSRRATRGMVYGAVTLQRVPMRLWRDRVRREHAHCNFACSTGRESQRLGDTCLLSRESQVRFLPGAPPQQPH
jgi:hypothetical protein